MSFVDLYLLGVFNKLAHTSYYFDTAVVLVGDSILIKGALLTSLLWLAWFRPGKSEKNNREFVIAIIAATITSILMIKIIRYFIPFEERPIRANIAGFVLPYGVTSETLWNWSSFPSDTAGFAMALSVGQIFIWGRRGALAVLFSLLFICMPRIYLGYHYPSDIAAGALIGAIVTTVMVQNKIRIPLSRRILSWSEANPGVFYWAFFLATYEIATVFEDVRRTLTQIWIMTHHT
ncbi:phosphatase PAP2 family protein [Rhodoblastus sp.]|uniref:phosphatase PAP2 family protein n=1 Tax=Rhodoblastus sp. TaxID=1962975 RepID=UPI0026094588|nr:phosphatase PAP2 family protein [Rhodoblastus sp.]